MGELQLESRSPYLVSLGVPLIGFAFTITFEVTVTFGVTIGDYLITYYVI